MRKLVNFVTVRWKKVPFYSLFCWIKRRQFFKALKIKAYLWHISCFVLPKLSEATRTTKCIFTQCCSSVCVAVPYTLRQKHYQIWCNDPILLSDKWLVCWAIFLPFCFISNGQLVNKLVQGALCSRKPKKWISKFLCKCGNGFFIPLRFYTLSSKPCLE